MLRAAKKNRLWLMTVSIVMTAVGLFGAFALFTQLHKPAPGRPQHIVSLDIVDRMVHWDRAVTFSDGVPSSQAGAADSVVIQVPNDLVHPMMSDTIPEFGLYISKGASLAVARMDDGSVCNLAISWRGDALRFQGDDGYYAVAGHSLDIFSGTVNDILNQMASQRITAKGN
jgi:hypothetical protein